MCIRDSVWALGVVANADVPCGKIDDSGGNKKWRNAARPTFEASLVLALDNVEPADARADVYSYALRNVVRHRQS